VTNGLADYVLDIICQPELTLEDLQPLKNFEILAIFALNNQEIDPLDASLSLKQKLLQLLQTRDCRVQQGAVPTSFGINVGPCQFSSEMHGEPEDLSRFTVLDHSHGCVLQCCLSCLYNNYLCNWYEDDEDVDVQFKAFAVACQRCHRSRSDCTIFEHGLGTWQLCHPCALRTFNILPPN